MSLKVVTTKKCPWCDFSHRLPMLVANHVSMCAARRSALDALESENKESDHNVQPINPLVPVPGCEQPNLNANAGLDVAPLEDLSLDVAMPEPEPADPTPDPTPDPFDFTYEFTKALTLANSGRGLPEKDIQTLIDIFNKGKALGRLDLEYDSLTSFKKYRSQCTMTDDNGWVVKTIEVTDKDVPGLPKPYSANFFHVKTDQWLAEEYGDEKNKEGFVVHASPRQDEDGNLIFNKPEESYAWIEAEIAIRQRPESSDGVVAALQFYSDKSLLNRKGLQTHPIKAALMNVPFSKRIFRIKPVGYLSPMFHKPAKLGAERWRLVKLHYINHAMSELTAPLKALSQTGIRLKDPNGVQRLVFPRLLSYVMDDPESKDIFCIQNSKKKCELCHMDASDFLKIEQRCPEKFEQEQKQHYEYAITKAKMSERVKECSKHSILPVPCGLWGFADQSLAGSTNIYSTLGFEGMHNDDLGVFLYIIDHLKKYFIKVLGKTPQGANELLSELNERMGSLMRTGN